MGTNAPYRLEEEEAETEEVEERCTPVDKSSSTSEEHDIDAASSVSESFACTRTLPVPQLEALEALEALETMAQLLEYEDEDRPGCDRIGCFIFSPVIEALLSYRGMLSYSMVDRSAFLSSSLFS